MSKKSNNLTIQEKMTELNELVSWFQSGAFSLDEALDKFKAAEMLADNIEKDLIKLKNDIKVVQKQFDA